MHALKNYALNAHCFVMKLKSMQDDLNQYTYLCMCSRYWIFMYMRQYVNRHIIYRGGSEQWTFTSRNSGLLLLFYRFPDMIAKVDA